MLPEQKIQEELSMAYVYAIASQAGLVFERPAVDIDSVDVKVSAIGKPDPSSLLESPVLEIQLKATYAHAFVDDELSFPLRLKNYNDLRKDTACERILMVYLMPENRDEWIKSDHEKLVLKTCGYWLSLRGRSETENTTSVTVKIPKTNIFNKDTLHDMMVKISKGESINNAL